MKLRIFTRTVDGESFGGLVVLTCKELSRSACFEFLVRTPVVFEFWVFREGRREPFMKTSPGCELPVSPEKIAIAEALATASSWLCTCVIHGTVGAVRAAVEINADITANGMSGYSLAFDYEIAPDKEADFRVEFEKMGELM